MKNHPILLTGGGMRAVELAAMEAGEVTGLELMERAGQGVLAAILAKWPELEATRERRAVILCGPGNNGGDGFVVARLLKARGWEVVPGLLGDPTRLPPDAAANLARWRELGEVVPLEALGVEALDGPVDLMVDALFGTGLARPLSPEVAGILTQAIEVAERTVAADILSGLCADSGRSLGGAPAGRIDLAVTFQTMKPGHLLGEGAGAMENVVVADIGLTSRTVAAEARGQGGAVTLIQDEACCADVAQKDGTGHKYNHGHALILSGGAGRTGAARLSARAALRIGAGLVTMAVPPAAQMEVAVQITAIMLRRVGNSRDLAQLLEDKRYSALCLGPGLGVGEGSRALVETALMADRSVVLDADALTSFSDAPEALFAMTRGRAVVMTPHDGEFARLFPDLADRMKGTAAHGPAYSRVDAVRDAAVRAGCVVLLKGPVTLMAEPGGCCLCHDALRKRPAPWLATAGAGDVLAGMITGLLARGWGPLEAAGQGAWLHVEAARRFGPGLIAEDLPEILPEVMAAMAS